MQLRYQNNYFLLKNDFCEDQLFYSFQFQLHNHSLIIRVSNIFFRIYCRKCVGTPSLSVHFQDWQKKKFLNMTIKRLSA